MEQLKPGIYKAVSTNVKVKDDGSIYLIFDLQGHSFEYCVHHNERRERVTTQQDAIDDWLKSRGDK